MNLNKQCGVSLIRHKYKEKGVVLSEIICVLRLPHCFKRDQSGFLSCAERGTECEELFVDLVKRSIN